MSEVVTLPVVHRSREAEMEAEARDVLFEIFPTLEAYNAEWVLSELKRRGYRIVRVNFQ